MSADRKNITWKESLKLNHRAYMLFYHKYPQMIISRMALIIWKAAYTLCKYLFFLPCDRGIIRKQKCEAH